MQGAKAAETRIAEARICDKSRGKHGENIQTWEQHGKQPCPFKNMFLKPGLFFCFESKVTFQPLKLFPRKSSFFWFLNKSITYKMFLFWIFDETWILTCF